MATITDVANAAGVSISTVSRVLNNSVLVTEEKRGRVMRAIEEVGYEIPRSMVIRGVKNKVILVITTISVTPLFSGLERAARETGYFMLNEFVNDSSEAYDQCADILRLLERDILCGVILVNVLSKSDKLATMFGDLPVVQIGEYYDLDPTYVVLTDDKKASHDITTLLINKGKKRIAFANMSQDFYFNAARLKGYRQALENHGLAMPPEYVFRADYAMEGGRDAVEYFLGLPQPPDAICCSSDHIAVGCVKELGRRGIKIPEEIAVTGFDDMQVAEASTPAVTTVAQAFEELGAEAVNTLEMILQGKLSRGRKVIVPHSIIERETT